jgi:hypothetical protein
MDTPISRRQFLYKSGALGAAAAGLSLSADKVEPVLRNGDGMVLDEPLALHRPDYPSDKPNVILIRFGGGVRRQETILDEARTYCPFIYHELYRNQGTLLSNVEIASAPGVETSHGQGTLYLITGKYDRYQDIERRLFSDRFEPKVPTIFEYFRRSYNIPEHQSLIVNGEDRINEEFYTFSNCRPYGINYRSTVLSLYQFKRFLLRDELAHGRLVGGQRVPLTDAERRSKALALAQKENLDYRESRTRAVHPAGTVGLLGSSFGQGPLAATAALGAPNTNLELDRFWHRWREHYGSSGFVNPRGDRLLTALALRALRELKPRLMMINYQDPDYVHWGNRQFYTRAISIIDEGVRELCSAVQADDEFEFYRNRTVFIVVPDCGRDSNRCLSVPFQHHFNSRSSHEIFAVAAGPRRYIQRSATRVERLRQQCSVAATVGQLMGFPVPHVDAGAGVLQEIFA